MRRFVAWAIIVIGNLLVLGLMMGLAAQEPQFHLRENFDDPALLGWEHPPSVRVADHVLRIEPGNAAFYSRPLRNLSLTVRARRLGKGDLSVRYMAGDRGSYFFRFGYQSIALRREEGNLGWIELDSAPISIPEDTWVTVHIVAVDGTHIIELDGEHVLTGYDPHPLPPSGIFLAAETQGGAVGEFDDLEVIGNE